MSNIGDSHRYLENDMMGAVTAVVVQLIKNNDRNNQQEDALEALCESVIGLREELGENSNSDQKLQENQRKVQTQ